MQQEFFKKLAKNVNSIKTESKSNHTKSMRKMEVLKNQMADFKTQMTELKNQNTEIIGILSTETPIILRNKRNGTDGSGNSVYRFDFNTDYSYKNYDKFTETVKINNIYYSLSLTMMKNGTNYYLNIDTESILIDIKHITNLSFNNNGNYFEYCVGKQYNDPILLSNKRNGTDGSGISVYRFDFDHNSCYSYNNYDNFTETVKINNIYYSLSLTMMKNKTNYYLNIYPSPTESIQIDINDITNLSFYNNGNYFEYSE